ncbi:hypothetical protein SAMN04488036_102409 [Shimia haliotis]|uniref:Uncharacterized protein n=1 Tax=Shimia haliotis TaxID=1280847 RepID=A0A1I4CRR3_9RHOB|nr:hypothetical protein SAMN04488036_102409 [Shimia haliotis]
MSPIYERIGRLYCRSIGSIPKDHRASKATVSQGVNRIFDYLAKKLVGESGLRLV